MCDRRLGRQPALDEPRRRRSLHHHPLAGAAGKLRSLRHENPELRRDHVEPLGNVLADRHHLSAAAGAGGALRHQNHLDPRQMRRQLAAAGTALGAALLPQLRIPLLGLGTGLGDRRLEVGKAEFQLLLRKPLGLPAELHPPQLQQERAQPVVLRLERITLRLERITHGTCVIALGKSIVAFGENREQRRTQNRRIVRQGGDVGRRGHARILTHRAASRQRRSTSHNAGKQRYPASAGRAVHTGIRQSIPSSSIDSCAGVSDTEPSRAAGQTKRPRSSRLAYGHSPWPSQNSSFTR
jgi:hypothetical protein